MFVIGLLIAYQTIGLAILFASNEKNLKNLNNDLIKNRDLRMNFLLSLVYMFSCYQLYTMDYTVFAIVGFTHAVILSLIIIFRSIEL
jgi:hypothetical protein